MLDRATPPPDEPPSHAHARGLLREWDRRDLKAVIQVNVDSILFIDPLGKPRTAWLYIASGKTRFCVEPGFPAYPTMALPADTPADAAPEVAPDPEPFPYQPPQMESD